MSTETALRKALAAFRHDANCWCGNYGGAIPHTPECTAARAALALPATEERLEYRISGERNLDDRGRPTGKWRTFQSPTSERETVQSWLARQEIFEWRKGCYRDLCISCRSVTAPGPWLPLEAKS